MRNTDCMTCTVKKEKCALQDLAYCNKTDKLKKGETNMVGYEIGRERMKNVQNEKDTVAPGIWQETVINVKYEKYTLEDLDCGEKTVKHGK